MRWLDDSRLRQLSNRMVTFQRLNRCIWNDVNAVLRPNHLAQLCGWYWTQLCIRESHSGRALLYCSGGGALMPQDETLTLTITLLLDG